MAFWPLNNSDFSIDQTFHQFYDIDTELDLHRIMSGFHGAFRITYGKYIVKISRVFV